MTSMSGYNERVQHLFNTLSSQGKVRVHSFEVRKPVKPSELERFRERFKLPDELVEFYQYSNGFQLSYTFTENEDFDKSSFGSYRGAFPYLWPNETYWHLDGCINVLPIEVIFNVSWKDYIWFDSGNSYTITFEGVEYDQSVFEKNIRPFDVFSKSSIAACYVKRGVCDILLSTDHNASYTDFRPMSLAKYLDGVINTEGRVNKRKDLFRK
jgi:hypothetical protein